MMKDPMTKARPKKYKKSFQSLVMQVPKPRIVLVVQLEDKFNKLKDNNYFEENNESNSLCSRCNYGLKFIWMDYIAFGLKN